MFGLFKSKARRVAAKAIYDQAVRAARAPHFYRDLGVPDTVMGRFDMIVLHVVMAIYDVKPRARLDNLSPLPARERARVRDNACASPTPTLPLAGGGSIWLAQDVFDEMFVDIERSIREMGVGDLSVPHKMRAMMRGFNGRAQSYVAAFAAARAGDDAPLREALRRNIFGTVDGIDPAHIEAMVGYVKEKLEGKEHEKTA